MKFVIALGNPGEEYEKSRHNLGFMVADKLIKKNEWEESPDDVFVFAEKGKGKEKAVFIKPHTFMNNSGKVIAKIKKKYSGLKSKDVLVVHDDLDIPLGRTKLTFGKSPAMHKGVESVIKALKTKNIWRLRVGIMPKRKPTAKAMKDFLLKNFTPGEEKIIKKMVKKSAGGIEVWLENPDKGMNFINQK